MSKKIDLERLTWDFGFVTNEDVLALVAAVRAARAMFAVDTDDVARGVAAMLALAASLSPFTDSAEVRSDA